MIKQEVLESGLVRTYSDIGNYIIQNETGIKYAEAIDVQNKYAYSESDEKVKEKMKNKYRV